MISALVTAMPSIFMPGFRGGWLCNGERGGRVTPRRERATTPVVTIRTATGVDALIPPSAWLALGFWFALGAIRNERDQRTVNQPKEVRAPLRAAAASARIAPGQPLLDPAGVPITPCVAR